MSSIGGKNTNVTSISESPGQECLRIQGIILLSVYQIAVVLAAIYFLVCFWSGAALATSGSSALGESTESIVVGSSGEGNAAVTTSESGARATLPEKNTVEIASILGSFALPLEVVLILIVACCGVLGSSLHCIRSLIWYVGNRDLRRSWILKYLIQPLVGPTLALIVYFLARAGFLSLQASHEDLNYIGFAAVAGLVGLFSDQVVVKLKKVAETIFDKAEAGKDQSLPKSGSSDSNKSAEPAKG